MDPKAKFVSEINDLIKEWEILQIKTGEKQNLGSLIIYYETWYTKALAIIRQVTPEREVDFVRCYKLENRKEVTYDTYTISDYLLNLVVKYGGKPTFSTEEAYSVKLIRQVGILQAAKNALPTAIYNMKAIIRAELLDGDIEAAKELLKSGYLRSAGVICGVILENHLKSIAEKHMISLSKKEPTISDLNDKLRDGKVYDVPMWRLIQRLADIRNLCAHHKDREPTRDEVQDLISGTEKVTKEIY